MIWCRFAHGNMVSYGVARDGHVRAVIDPFLNGCSPDSPRFTGEEFDLSEVKLLVPTVPKTFFCVGVNYRDHIIKAAERAGQSPVFPDKPDIGYRANNALIAHEENIVKPADATAELQYEGELVAVFGRAARRVSKDHALDHVFGWTIGNDISERSWQRVDRTLWRAKNSDSFKPMGPWIVTDLSPHDMITTITVNGEVTDSFPTAGMIFDVADYVSTVSRYCTIAPGDVMWMGTDGSPTNISPGDVVEVEISGIGVLRNYVVSESSVEI